MSIRVNTKNRSFSREKREKQRIIRNQTKRRIATSISVTVPASSAPASALASVSSSYSSSCKDLVLVKRHASSGSNGNGNNTVTLQIPITEHHKRALLACPNTAINTSAKRLKRLYKRSRIYAKAYGLLQEEEKASWCLLTDSLLFDTYLYCTLLIDDGRC